MRLLLVEDDELLAHQLRVELNSRGYVIDKVSDGEAGWNYSQAIVYDLIVLDVTLPKLDGIALCRKLRQNKYKGPILLLAANTEKDEKVKGLDAGADDYMIKPCTIEELSARIRALLRRGEALGGPILRWGQLSLDPTSREVTYQKRYLSLSAKEYNLLELLIRHPRRIFSSATILDHLWSFEEVPGEDTVRAHIKRLRKKLNAAGAREIIETVYGMGYRLNSAFATLPDNQEVDQEVSEQIRQKVAQTWEKLRSPLLARIDDIDKFIAEKTPENCQSAQSAAHKLVGSLGMFGFHKGSEIALEIENLLKAWDNNDKNWQNLQDYLRKLRVEFPDEADQKKKNQAINDLFPVNEIKILLITQDKDWQEALLESGKKWGMTFIVPRNIENALPESEDELSTPDVILLDLDGESLNSLEKLSHHYPQVPVIVVTGSENFGQRLEAARKGGKRFTIKSTPPMDMLALVRDAVYLQPSPALNVLAVDDDEMILEFLVQTLSPWGFQVTTLQKQEGFWETLESLKPDLLLLDVEMEGITGIELCQVVRNARVWDNLPIIFFTSCVSADTVQTIFNAGADDYIAKPIQGRELVGRIIKRIERHQAAIRN